MPSGSRGSVSTTSGPPAAAAVRDGPDAARRPPELCRHGGQVVGSAAVRDDAQAIDGAGVGLAATDCRTAPRTTAPARRRTGAVASASAGDAGTGGRVETT